MTAQPVHPDTIIDQYRRRRVILVVALTILWLVVSASIVHLCHDAWYGDREAVKGLVVVVLLSAGFGQFLNGRDIFRLARS